MCKPVFDREVGVSIGSGHGWCVDVAVRVVPGPAVDLDLGVSVHE